MCSINNNKCKTKNETTKNKVFCQNSKSNRLFFNVYLKVIYTLQYFCLRIMMFYLKPEIYLTQNNSKND